MNYKLIVLLIATAGIVFTGYARKKKQKVTCPSKAPLSFHSLKAETIDGKTVSMADYKGKYILVVNTASKCGYTGQYKDLQELSEKYKDKLVVVGFPSNDFLWQEPGSNETIKNFCSVNYHVTFPLFSKVVVKGKKKHPVYEWLTNPKQNGWNKTKPGWNFNKYLIDPNGNLLEHFGASVKPLSDKITQHIK
jgi:glutathione peroxidase